MEISRAKKKNKNPQICLILVNLFHLHICLWKYFTLGAFQFIITAFLGKLSNFPPLVFAGQSTQNY